MCICIAIFITPIAATSQEGGTISSWIEQQKLTNVDIHFTASIPENSVAALVVYRDKCALKSYSEVCEVSIVTKVNGTIRKFDLFKKFPINLISFELAKMISYGGDHTPMVKLEFSDLRDQARYHALWRYIKFGDMYLCASQYCGVFTSDNFQCSGNSCTGEMRLGGDDGPIQKWSTRFGIPKAIELLRLTQTAGFKSHGKLLKGSDLKFFRHIPHDVGDCIEGLCFSYVTAYRGNPFEGGASVFLGASMFSNNCEASVSCFENNRNEEICQFECGAVRLGVSADTLIVEK